MKRSILLAICLSAAAAFAGAYDIGDFSAKDEVSADTYVVNNGNPLNTTTADEVTSLSAGNLVLRQKFIDQAGLHVYQLYTGRKGDISSLTPMSIPSNMSYSQVVKAKIYKRRGTMPGDDVEKVYFDGKFVYAPGLTSAVAYVNGAPVDLLGEEKASTQSAAPKKTDCDEFDMSCDDDDISSYKSNVDVSGDLNKTNSYADSRNYSASAAAQDVTARFGIADEVRFWSAVALSAFAAGSAVIGVLQHMKSSDANDAYKKLEDVSNKVDNKITNACSELSNPDACIKYYKETTDPKAFIASDNNWTYRDLQQRMKTNKDTKDSYATFRNVWFGISAVSLTSAIILFAW